MKEVYLFSEGRASMRNLLGGKGANLCELKHLGISVPEGFIISTAACNRYLNNDLGLDEKLLTEIKVAMTYLEKETGKNFGASKNPLLVSVRSGAQQSMPGMMDTILNLGFNDSVLASMAKIDEFFAYDTYRRFIEMYSNVVDEINLDEFSSIKQKYLSLDGVVAESELSVSSLKSLIEDYKDIYFNHTGYDFPQDVEVQLLNSIKAVFNSWNNPRARYYRKINGYSDSWGTAVTVQSMVFGNLDNMSGTGVCFSRNPSNGQNELYGEYLVKAQGEDVVAGTHTPVDIQVMKKNDLENYRKLKETARILEKHYQDMQDIEFTIESGKLYILQTRKGKRTAQAALKIATDFYTSNLSSFKNQMKNLDQSVFNQLIYPQFSHVDEGKMTKLTKGMPASPGAASGKIAFSSEKVSYYSEKNIPSILIRSETSPDDIIGMDRAEGVLTLKGGLTSHAAVVTRSMAKPCIVSCENASLDLKRGIIKFGDKIFREGDDLSIDGSVGYVYQGLYEIERSDYPKELFQLVEEAKKHRDKEIYVNADTPVDIRKGLAMGASGIGLVRTEHMFFEKNRLINFQKMILSSSDKERKDSLKELLLIQEQDFYDLFLSSEDYPITIRLLDPPLHEFMPNNEKEVERLSRKLSLEPKVLEKRIEFMKEINPMMGHRGSRLAITYPEIYQMQVQAIAQAGNRYYGKFKKYPRVEIMLPLISDLKEYHLVSGLVRMELNKWTDVGYKVGTMIETPRACLIADKLAEKVDFISFGTNDLTQLTFGFSRDDSAKFMPEYQEKQVLEKDPFQSIDVQAVGGLMEIAINKARKVNPEIQIGVCGEHAGDLASIDYLKTLDLNYLSCSVYRLIPAQLKSV